MTSSGLQENVIPQAHNISTIYKWGLFIVEYFPVDIMKPSCIDGQNLSIKLIFSVSWKLQHLRSSTYILFSNISCCSFIPFYIFFIILYIIYITFWSYLYQSQGRDFDWRHLAVWYGQNLLLMQMEHVRVWHQTLTWSDQEHDQSLCETAENRPLKLHKHKNNNQIDVSELSNDIFLK